MVLLLERFISWVVSQIIDHRKVIWLVLVAMVTFMQWAVRFVTETLMQAINELVNLAVDVGNGSIDMSSVDQLTGGVVGWTLQIIPLEVLIACTLSLVALHVSIATIRLVIQIYKLIPFKAS
jgi:hypothetical protein